MKISNKICQLSEKYKAVNKRICSVISTVLIAACCQPICAAGLWLYEAATPEVGSASAGRNAVADSASTAAFNPAGMTRLKQNELMLGIQPMYVDAHFDIDFGSGAGGSNGGNAGGWVPVISINYVHELSPD